MAAPLDPLHLDDAIARYLAGEPFEQINAATGVSASALHRERNRRGVPPRRIFALPADEVASSYLSGESECGLAARYGVSRSVIRRHLARHGVAVRGTSEAGKVRAGKMTAEQRQTQAAAAHRAVRGTRVSLDQLIARAAARESRGGLDSPGERFLYAELVKRGESPISQKAIGKYNVDLALPPVAVEVLGGGWHATKRSHAERTPDILDQGWCLVFVWNHEGDSALREGAADYVVAFADEVRRDPSLIGEYRVISGSGEPLAGGRVQDGEFALVPPPRGRLDRRA